MFSGFPSALWNNFGTLNSGTLNSGTLNLASGNCVSRRNRDLTARAAEAARET